MTQRSGFFNAKQSSGNYDRVYMASDFADYFASFIGNGVFAKSSEQLQVMPQDPPAMSVQVLAGQAWINGYWYENTAPLTLDIDVADGTLDRIDIIVARYDLMARDVTIVVKKGTPSAGATAPALSRTKDLYELKLADINVSHGTVNISTDKITDTRSNSEVCGWVTGIIDQMDTTTLFNQLQAATQDAVDAMNNALNDVWGGIKDWLLNNVYKVGYVWISYTDTSPSSLLGGTWTPITGRFPYFNAGSDTGGSNTHTLTEAEMPSHSHAAKSWHNVVQQYEGIASKPCVAWEDWLDDGYGAWSTRTGGGGSHNNMPAYQTLYAWRRVE